MVYIIADFKVQEKATRNERLSAEVAAAHADSRTKKGMGVLLTRHEFDRLFGGSVAQRSIRNHRRRRSSRPELVYSGFRSSCELLAEPLIEALLDLHAAEPMLAVKTGFREGANLNATKKPRSSSFSVGPVAPGVCGNFPSSSSGITGGTVLGDGVDPGRHS